MTINLEHFYIFHDIVINQSMFIADIKKKQLKFTFSILFPWGDIGKMFTLSSGEKQGCFSQEIDIHQGECYLR